MQKSLGAYKRITNTMIVKVQLSYISSEQQPQVLVYNKTKEFYYQGDATSDIIKAMVIDDFDNLRLQIKRYFNARYDRATKQIELLNEVNDQLW